MASSLLLILLLISSAMAGEVSINSFQKMEERRAHLRFYLHDIINPGPAATAVRVANIPPATPFVKFGDVFVLDDLMTEGPNRSSKALGRAQGIYAAASLAGSEQALLMAVTFMFTGGPYKGSTVEVLTRLAIPRKVREFPVVGGTGRFRLARGYIFASPIFVNATTGDSISEYNLYVLHY